MIFSNLSLIYCSDKNNLIGLNLVYTDDTGTPLQIMPWGNNNITDLKYFKSVTEGHTVIMGYNTFKTIGRPLINRTNIVLSRTHAEKIKQEFPNVIVFTSIDEIYKYLTNKASFNEKCFIIGGNQLFMEFWQCANYIYHTEISNYKSPVNNNEIKSKIYIQTINHNYYDLLERLYVDDKNNSEIKYIRNVYKRKTYTSYRY